MNGPIRSSVFFNSMEGTIFNATIKATAIVGIKKVEKKTSNNGLIPPWILVVPN